MKNTSRERINSSSSEYWTSIEGSVLNCKKIPEEDNSVWLLSFLSFSEVLTERVRGSHCSSITLLERSFKNNEVFPTSVLLFNSPLLLFIYWFIDIVLIWEKKMR